MSEQLYQFVDITGKCFESFQELSPDNNIVGSWLRGGREFEVGDMMAFRDELKEAGFKWGKDFYVRKVEHEVR